jgi:hypothetical protein
MTFEAKAKVASSLRRAVDAPSWLGLAATPTFALMGWISAVGSPGMAMCSPASVLPIGDMALMYLLMSLFHVSPWLKLISARNTSTTRTQGD